MVLHSHRRASRFAIARIAVLRAVAVLGVAFSLFCVSVGPSFAAGGTTGNVDGTVHSASGQPIAGASVSLASPSGTFSRKTDARGFFSFLGVPVDTYTISIEAQGFQPLLQTGVTVAGGGTVELGTVNLQTELKTIGRVSARSLSSAFQPNQTIPQFTINGATLEAAQGKRANANEANALLAVPGFQLDSVGNLILQGSTIDQVHYQLDGADFTDPGFTTNINGAFFNGIGTVQVVPGAGDPSQGNAGAGVVNLIVKRGTYPGTGLLDLETDVKPFYHQLNVQYGAATADGRLSDYFSFFGTRGADQFGPFGSDAAAVNSLYGTSFVAENDFVNNFVYRFGKSNAQSLQVLYLNHNDQVQGNYGGLSLQYPSSAPDISFEFPPLTGLTLKQAQSIIGFEQGQTSPTGTIPNNIIANTNASLLKFEYDNQLNASTFVALRYFDQSSFTDSFANGPTQFSPIALLRTEQTSGGSRVGATFEIDKQLNAKNLVSLSGSYEFNRPNFASTSPYVGLFDIGLNAQDFLRPPNPNQPVGPGNPCPVTGGCYLQQFFYMKGGTPPVPSMTLSSRELQNQYGMGLRDQIQISNNVRFDAGVRYDLINNGYGNNLFYANENTQPVPGAPTIPFITNYPFVEQPHFLEPRAGLSVRLTDRDSLQFSYGRAINLQGQGALASPEFNSYASVFGNIPVNPNYIATGDPFISYRNVGPNNCFSYLPYPIGAGPNAQPSYNGTVAGPSPTLQLGRQCANYGELLYGANDAFYPEVSAVQPVVFNEYDLSISHEFRNGSALKIAPFFRQGAEVTAVTANLIDVNGQFQPGTLTNQSAGKSTTTGVDFLFSLPEHPVGLTGFLSATYINEFTNTPPTADNPFAQDFEPLILPQSLAAGNLYRAGFISPFTATLGGVYKTRSGFRINPDLHFNIGYPIGSGLLTPILFNGAGTNVPNTNFTNQFAPNGTPQYVDPANPGSIFAPNIAASRGTPEKASGGGVLSNPQVTADVTLEYSPPGSRGTFGLQVLNAFGNEYGFGGAGGLAAQPLTINSNYFPVTTGVAGPLTGQNFNNLFVPNEVPLVTTGTYPYAPYNIAPTQPVFFRLYFQYAL